MELALLIYAIGISSSLSVFLEIAAIILLITTVLYAIVETVLIAEDPLPDDEDIEKTKKRVFRNSKILLGSIALLATLSVLFPDEKTSYTMLAAYEVQEIATNDRVQNAASNSLTLIEQEIGKYLEKETKGE